MQTHNSAKQKYTCEVFPREIEDKTQLLASIKAELGGLINLKAESGYKYLLFRDATGISLKQYITSDSQAWISTLQNFYWKLYAWNIAFNKVLTAKWAGAPRHYYTVGLNSHHSLQIKKPWEIGLNTFASSAGLIENVINEIALNLKEWEFIEFNFSMVPSSYDKLAKEIIYAIKEFNMSDEYKEELRGSFNDKLGFFLFNLTACHNMINASIFSDIFYKNLRLYDSPYNSYEYKYSRRNYPTIANRYRKGQVDMFLAHGLVSLISHNSRYTKKLPSAILSVNSALSDNNGTWKKQGIYKTYVWKGMRGLSLDDQEHISFDEARLKNAHSIILWRTGSWKSYTTSPVIGYDITRSIVQDRINFEKHGSPRGQHIVIDPHNSLWGNIATVLWVFQKSTNAKYSSEYQVTRYQRNTQKNIFLNTGISAIPHKVKSLVFNPLYLSKTDITDPKKLLWDINRATMACLEWIRAIYTKASFWPQNTEVIFAVVQLFLLFNVFRNTENKWATSYKDSYIRMYTLGDIHTFLEEMEITKSMPHRVFNDFKEILNSQLGEVGSVARKLKIRIDYFLGQLIKNSGYLSSSINKLAPYSIGLKETFGGNISHLDYAFDINELFIQKDYEKTNIHLFDLSGYSTNEKNIIAGWLLAYSYHSGSTKDHENKKELMSTTIWVDEASAVLNGEYILEVIASSLAEMRKYRVTYNFFLRSIDQKAFSLIYPNIGYLFIFSVDYRQADLIINDLNSGSPWKLLVHNDIINNQRWRFYAFFKFTNGGNSTLLIEGFDMNIPEVTYLLS